jgi:hypothetical protein
MCFLHRNVRSTRTQASLSTATHVFRMRVVQTFLVSGTPINRLKFFRPLIERSGVSLSHESNLMSTYVPMIEANEFQLVKSEIHDQYVCIAFDGTSRLGEAMNIVGRFCSQDFCIENRLLRFKTTRQHVKAPQLAQLITQTLCTELGFRLDMLVGLSRDSVGVNGAACRLLMQSTFTCAVDMMCISHTLNNVGRRISFDILREFMTPWLDLVGGRNPHRGAQQLWKATVYPMQVPGFSNTRWYAAAEIQFVLAENYHHLADFIDKLGHHDYGDATLAKMKAVFSVEDKRYALQLQLAAMLDMRELVKVTYELEGDRLELLLVYDRIEGLRNRFRAIRNGHDGVLQNVDAVLRNAVKLRNGTKMSKVSLAICLTPIDLCLMGY